MSDANLSDSSISSVSSVPLNMKKSKVKPIDRNGKLLNALNNTQSEAEVFEVLGDRTIGDRISKNGRTAFYHILTNSSLNGVKIVNDQLDECIREEENKTIQVNLKPLNSGVIKELLWLRGHGQISKLLRHPIVKIFLGLKWKKVRLIFFLNFLIYFTFLAVYSAFLGDIFYRRVNKEPAISFKDLKVSGDRILFPSDEFQNIFLSPFNETAKAEEMVKKLKLRPTFSKCGTLKNGSFGGKYRHLICFLEVSLSILLGILLIQEIIQLGALGPNTYFREFENWLEICIIFIVLVSLTIQRNEDAFKYLSAIGICLSYLEFIFLMGRYPFLGGQISLMFYSITRHLYRSVINLLILLVGFAFGFFIISHAKPNDHFENPVKAMLKTFVMALGEYEFDDLYLSHADDPISLFLAMLLLVGLIIIGSLVMINLLVAIIVSDITTLKEASQTQELVNKAQQIIHAEGILFYLPKYMARWIKIPDEITVCSHIICSCENLKVNDLFPEIKEVIKKRNIKKMIERLVWSNDNRSLLQEDESSQQLIHELIFSLL